MTKKHRREALEAWNGEVEWTYDGIRLALLAAIMDELKALNATLRCPDTQRIPRYLRRIANNTAKPRKAKERKR